MRSRSHALWLILLLLSAAVTLGASDVASSADGWEQLDEARAAPAPVTGLVLRIPVERVRRAPERSVAKPARVAEAEIFRPPIA